MDDERGANAAYAGEDKNNDNDISRHHHTPSKRRVNLGTPANYYFKYMNSSKKNHTGEMNAAVMMSHHEDDEDTGTISIPGLNLGGNGANTETSFLSMAAESCSGSEASDLLNKSTLSDTTELTASNFVLVTTSKQQLARSAHHQQHKTERELKAERALEILEREALETNKEMDIKRGDLEDSKPLETNKEKDTKRGDLEDSKPLETNEEKDIKRGDLEDSTQLTIESIHDKENNGSVKRFSQTAKRDNAGVGEDANQQIPRREAIGIRDSSPSLRSRISSSPASLKKFHQDLRNSRLKRQMQREEDAKRRLSTDSATSISLMHAQLEALTTDTNISRKRLPPSFLQASQFSQSMESSPVGSEAASEAASNNESTSFIDMDDLNDLLGISHNTADENRKSSITAHYDTVVEALETGTLDTNPTIDHVSKTDIGTAVAVAAVNAPASFIGTKSSSGSDDVSDSKIELDAEPETMKQQQLELKKPSPSQQSPSESIYRRTPGSRHKLTPGRLSSGPKRVINPVSSNSPAANTRSAKKSDSNTDLETSTPILDDRVVPVGETKNTNMVSSRFLDRLSCTKSVSSTNSGKSDETASLEDIEELFGKSVTHTSPSIHMSPDKSMISYFGNDKSSSLQSLSRKNNETASIHDIRDALGKKFPDCPTVVESEGFPQMDNVENLINQTKVSHQRNSSIASGMDAQATPQLTSIELSKLRSSTSCEKVSEQGKESLTGKSSVVDRPSTLFPQCMESPNINDSHEDGIPSPSDGTPTTPPIVGLSTLSPSVNKLLSQSNQSNKGKALFIFENDVSNMDSSFSSLKDPMRLVPNSHIAPTPTKLAPTPRRVLNPNNPNSPARNTRSASRIGRSPSSHLESSRVDSTEGSKRQRDELTIPFQLFNEDVVSRSKKRRQSSFAPASASKRSEKRPHGIMSSRKKPFSSQRSVAFGSPKAAEYNIGSPSVSLTPMPRGRAKALFRLPSGEESHKRKGEIDENLPNSETKAGDNRAETMELQSGLNVLVDKITPEDMNTSPELSPIAKSKSDTGNYNVDVSVSSTSEMVENDFSQEGKTVELEVGMDSLLAHAWNNSPSDSEAHTPSNFESTKQETSMEMTDTDTIASMHSRRSGKFTTEFVLPVGQRLDFSVASEEMTSNEDESEMECEDSDTVALEDGMTILINANEIANTEKNAQNQSFEHKAPTRTVDSILEERQTVVLEENITELFEAASSADFPSERMASFSRTPEAQQEVPDGETAELECNMTKLLSAAGLDLNEGQHEVKADDEAVSIENGNESFTSIGMINASEMTNGHSRRKSLAKCNESFTSIGTINASEMTNGHSRRKSLASQSFILRQPDQLTVSVDDVEDRSIVVNERSVSFCDTTEFIVSSNASYPRVDDPLDQALEALREDQIEIFSSKLFDELEVGANFQSVLSTDALSRFGNSSGTYHDLVVLERLRQFVELVCTEVEKNTDPEGTALDNLKSQIEEQPTLFAMLNKRFVEHKENGENPISIQIIIENGRKAVAFEWNDWLKTVLQSFQGPLGNIPNVLMEEYSSLYDALEHCRQNQDIADLLSQQKTQYTRKKSLLRRKRSVVELEKEIRSIESQVTMLECDLQTLGAEEIDSEVERARLSDLCRFAAKFDDVRQCTEESQKTYLSLRGLHSWSLGSMGEVEMNISMMGTCSQTTSMLSYNWEEPDRIRAKVTTFSGATHTTSQFRYRGPLSLYVDTHMRLLAQRVEQEFIDDASAIAKHVRKCSWMIGRLDLAAREISVLQKRYKATLTRTDRESFSLWMKFEGNSSSVEVEFPLDPMHPSFPVEVRLELISGSLDFEELRKLLIKQSKPGFGSLSRACDIVESFVRG
ncbi:hypothetical protein IV203_036474 [Nitzschia inconspicua]|uniref:Spc7 kinetochore protein domain-containing protein n=1 Tax=Nitzschia inconspicua TaxID=303405 RepID=A0A9K3LGM7_9STRA|nr:hypothetical protein IV203_036474 [Nitzschia inconspicua]